MADIVDPALNAAAKIEYKRMQLRLHQLMMNRIQMDIRIAEIEEEKRRLLENFPLFDNEEKEIKEKIKESYPQFMEG